MPPDPVGGREAEIEAVAQAISYALRPRIAERPVFDPARAHDAAKAALDALDALRSSGSAAQNQEAEDGTEGEVKDDALHIEGPLGMTLCGQRTAKDTNLGTLDELKASRGMDCWTCHDLAARSPQGEGQSQEPGLAFHDMARGTRPKGSAAQNQEDHE